MNIGVDVATWAISGAVSAGMTFGIIKMRLQNSMTFSQHREICQKERAETNKQLEKLFDAQKETHGMIKEVHGFLKAKNGGQL